jgi:hypothetical protein
MKLSHVIMFFVAGVLGLPTTEQKLSEAALEKPVVAARQMTPPGGG